MAKKKTGKRGHNRKKASTKAQTRKPIVLCEAVGTERTETIDVGGYDKFTVTFIVPGIGSELQMAADSEELGYAPMAVKYITEYAQKWSLSGDPTEENIERLPHVGMIAEMLDVIKKSASAEKNL